jgi:fluoride exporter
LEPALRADYRFSSFAYAVAVLTTASTASAVVASAYVVISLVLGYIAVIVGLKLGKQRSAERR